MNVKSLLAPGRFHRAANPKSFLHRFSDSVLHTSLMVAVVLIATLAMVKAVDMGITIWQLDRVVIEGQGSSR